MDVAEDSLWLGGAQSLHYCSSGELWQTACGTSICQQDTAMLVWVSLQTKQFYRFVLGKSPESIIILRSHAKPCSKASVTSHSIPYIRRAFSAYLSEELPTTKPEFESGTGAYCILSGEPHVLCLGRRRYTICCSQEDLQHTCATKSE